MNKIETKILNCSAIQEAEKNMVFTARLTQRGHLIQYGRSHPAVQQFLY